ncbi:hypothetical protein STANM309S_04573 [Streptomyces tanashiensis]
MTTPPAYEDSHLSRWLRVREFAVPPSMIETATARRQAGDWAGACAAAHVDVDLDLRALARSHGTELAARVRADLRRLAPDLLRWHMPRIAPDGLLRPGLTLALARYGTGGRDGSGPVHLVARTAPAWADSAGSGSASRSAAVHRRTPATDPRMPIRTPVRTPGSGSTCTATSGTRAGPVNCAPAPGPRIRRRPASAHRICRRAGSAAPWGAGRRRRRSCCCEPKAGRRARWPCAWRKGHRLLLAPTRVGGGPCGGRRGWRFGARPPRRASATVPVLTEAGRWLPPDLELLRAGLVEAGGLHAAGRRPRSCPVMYRPVGTGRPTGRAAPRLEESGYATAPGGLVDGSAVRRPAATPAGAPARTATRSFALTGTAGVAADGPSRRGRIGALLPRRCPRAARPR